MPLKDLQGWHDSTPEHTIRVAWTKDSSIYVQDRTTVNLTNWMSNSHHYVYSWAIQGNWSAQLRGDAIDAIKVILSDMPKGIKSIKDTRDLVLISFQQDGVSRSYAYQRTKLPPAVIRLCLLAKIGIDVAPRKEADAHD